MFTKNTECEEESSLFFFFCVCGVLHDLVILNIIFLNNLLDFLIQHLPSGTKLYFSSDLADLVEIIHVIIRLMENLQARGTLRVSSLLP